MPLLIEIWFVTLWLISQTYDLRASSSLPLIIKLYFAARRTGDQRSYSCQENHFRSGPKCGCSRIGSKSSRPLNQNHIVWKSSYKMLETAQSCHTLIKYGVNDIGNKLWFCFILFCTQISCAIFPRDPCWSCHLNSRFFVIGCLFVKTSLVQPDLAKLVRFFLMLCWRLKKRTTFAHFEWLGIDDKPQSHFHIRFKISAWSVKPIVLFFGIYIVVKTSQHAISAYTANQKHKKEMVSYDILEVTHKFVPTMRKDA